MTVTLAAPFLRRYLSVATPSSRRVVSKLFPFWGRSRSRRRRIFLPSTWEDSRYFIRRPLYHKKRGNLAHTRALIPREILYIQTEAFLPLLPLVEFDKMRPIILDSNRNTWYSVATSSVYM